MAKISLFIKVSETVLFGRVPLVQKIFSGYDSYTYIPTQLRPPSVEVSSHEDHMSRSECVKVTQNEQKLTLIDCTNIFMPKGPSKHSQIKFFFELQEKELIQTLWAIKTLSATHCTNYALTLVNRGLNNDQFLGFPDINSYNSKSIYNSNFKIAT